MRLWCFKIGNAPQKKRGLTFIEKWGYDVSQIGNTPLKENGFNLH
jgi:hypothetical protein